MPRQCQLRIPQNLTTRFPGSGTGLGFGDVMILYLRPANQSRHKEQHVHPSTHRETQLQPQNTWALLRIILAEGLGDSSS